MTPEDIRCVHRWAIVITSEGTYVNRGFFTFFVPAPSHSLMDPTDASLTARDREHHERAGAWQPQP